MSKFERMKSSKSYRFVDHLLTLAFIFLISAFMSCQENGVIETVDFQEIWEKDSITIENYITDNNLDPVFTTASGARYAIQSVGDGDSVRYNDLITINYTAYDGNGVVFKSTVTPADSQYYIYPIYDPLTFTYTSSGWTLEYTSLFATLQGDGLSEAISSALVSMKTGGSSCDIIAVCLGLRFCK